VGIRELKVKNQPHPRPLSEERGDLKERGGSND